jgi:acyl-CoA reductase-like NAD-dependent aldehyde dehydrogenase
MHFYNVINGTNRSSENHGSVQNPRTDEPLWNAPLASKNDLDDAVIAAQAAFRTWSKLPVGQRQSLIRNLAEEVKAQSESLCDILSKETGKSV